MDADTTILVPDDTESQRRSPNLDLKTERDAKLVVLSALGTFLFCRGDYLPGLACFAVMLPWTMLVRVSAWLARPVIRWRLKGSRIELFNSKN